VELIKAFKFNLKEQRLCYISHIFNLIAKAYLFGQDVSSFKDDFEKAGPP
jgi:hypothetical protein